MSREEKIEYINDKLREADDETLDEIFWALDLEGWEEVIRMYLIGEKGGRIAVNREISMRTIINQLPGMEDRELEMTSDYIKGLKLARKFRKWQDSVESVRTDVL